MHCLTWSYKNQHIKRGTHKQGEKLTSKVKNLKAKRANFQPVKEESGTYHQAARELSTLQDAGTAETSLSLWHSSGCGG